MFESFSTDRKKMVCHSLLENLEDLEIIEITVGFRCNNSCWCGSCSFLTTQIWLKVRNLWSQFMSSPKVLDSALNVCCMLSRYCISNCENSSSELAASAELKNLFFFSFFFFFSIWVFLSRTFTIHRTAGEGGGHFCNSLLPLPPASQTLRLLQRAHLCT